MYPVSLTGAKVTLREFRPDDVDAAHEIVGDDAVTRWLSFDSRDRVQTSAMLAAAVERARSQPRGEYYLAVVQPENGAPVGEGALVGDGALVGFARLGLTGIEAAKLGYAIRHDRWGHGYATDAVRTILDFGFRVLRLHRVSAAIGPDNAASIRVVTRLGFRPEGRLRDHVYTNGAWRDSLLYSVLAPEWAP